MSVVRDQPLVIKSLLNRYGPWRRGTRKNADGNSAGSIPSLTGCVYHQGRSSPFFAEAVSIESAEEEFHSPRTDGNKEQGAVTLTAHRER